MKKTNSLAGKLLHLIKKNGIDYLLPQNISDEFLSSMLKEAENIDMDTVQESSPNILSIAVLFLSGGDSTRPREAIRFKIEFDIMAEHFSLYVTQLYLESLRRRGEIEIVKDSMPTRENIFDKNRDIGFIQA